MPTCIRCGTVYSESELNDDRCAACGSYISRSATVSHGAGDTDMGTVDYSNEPDANAEPEPPTGRGLVQPRNISPEYSRHITQAWAATHSQFTHPRETLNSSSSAAVDPAGLLIGSRSVVNVGDKEPGDYELRDTIGEGNMGTVFAARQSALDRDVAVKIPKPHASESELGRSQFISEVIVTGQLDHPSIVPIYDLGRDKLGRLFYSMKRVEGRPWNECMHDGSLTQQENIEILMKVCDAIRFAHDRGVLHRDIKPHNVMVGKYGEVSVMDWGIALRMDDRSPAGGLTKLNPAGTPAYMAPEMASVSRGEIGPHSDVYLLGAVLFEIITGEPPHPAPMNTDNTTQAMQDALLIAARNEIIPVGYTGELVDIAFKALATDTSHRYQRVDEFQAAIRSYYSHVESIVLADRGHEYLSSAANAPDGGYENFAKARFAFEEALKLWPENSKASSGLSQATVAYAQTALDRHDYALGISLLDRQNNAHSRLLNQLETAKRKRDRNRTVARLSLWAAACSLLLGTVVSLFFYYGESIARQDLADKHAELENLNANLKTTNEELDENKKEIERNYGTLNKQKIQIDQQNVKLTGLNTTLEKEVEDRKKAEALALEQKESAERASYRFEVGLAADEIERNAFDAATPILEQQATNKAKSGLRSWEWGHLSYLTSRHVDSFGIANGAKVPGRVETAAISQAQAREDQLIAAGTAEGKVYVWKRLRGQQPIELHYGKAVHSVALSNDGKWLAAGGEDDSTKGSVKIWRLDNLDAEPTTVAPHGQRILSVAFSNDSSLLLTCSADGTARTWPLSSPRQPRHKLRGQWANKNVAGARFSPDDRYIAVWGEGRTVRVWNAQTGAPLAPIRGDEMPAIVSLDFAPSGDFVVMGGDDGRLITVPFDPNALKLDEQKAEIENAIKRGESSIELHELGRHAAAIRDIRFSPNGDRLFTASDDNTIGVWNLSQGLTNSRLEKQLRGHGSWVRACDTTSDGQRVLSAGYDGRVRLWDWDSYRFPIFLRVAETQSVGDLRINSGAISPNAEWVATAFQSGEVIVWDIQDPSNPVPQNLQEGHSFQATTGILFDGGQRLLTSGGDSTTLIWDTRHGRERLRIGPSTTNGRTGAGTGWRGVAAVSHDERRIATGGERAGVLAQLWDADSGRQLGKLSIPTTPASPSQEPPEATALDFSLDDAMLVVGDQNGVCYLFETATGKLHRQFRGHFGKVTSAHFLPGGRYLFTAGADRRAVKWDLEANVPRMAAVLPHGDEVLAMAVSTDGRRAVTACGSNDAQAVVRVWDLGSDAPRVTAQLKLQELADAHEQKINPEEKPLVRSISLHPTDPRAFVSLYFPSNSTTFRYEVGEWNWREVNAYRFVSRRLSDVSTALYARGRNGEPEAMLAVGGRGAHLWAAQPKPNGAIRFARQAMDLQPQFGARSVAFSADSRRLASAADDGSVRTWQLDASRRWLPGPTLRGSRMASVAFHPEQNDALLTAGDDGAQLWKSDALNQAWNLDAELRRPNGASSSAQQAVFSPDGNRQLVLSNGAVTLWEGNAPQEIPGITDATCVAFSPGGDWICIGTRSGGVDIRRADAPNDSVTNTDRQSGGHSGEITSATFSSDAQRIFTASRDFTIRVWDVSDLSNDDPTAGNREIRSMMTLDEHGREVTSVSFSPVAPAATLGPFLLSTGLDGQAILWPSVPYPINAP